MSTTEQASPVTERGRRTMTKLVDAAAVVFARKGFLDTKITDITAEAGVANGSFYTYFESKEVIFRAVIDEVNERMFTKSRVPAGAGSSPYQRIEHATRAYVRAYREEAGLLMILEQVASFSPAFREMRRETRKSFRSRTERGIRRFQEAGLVSPSLPPDYTAAALISMVSNFCYMWLVLDEDYDEETAILTLSRLWAQALGIEVEPRTASSDS
ncbi:TetR/AcrR family transcriptional regulator [Micromonospora sp. NPDC005173]|uniref:TetR/AcrR family transcriptional regulator n=1 Tax=Micromonospora sp. NPDC005173 TaxID=3157165 RepID=UPI0033BC168A